MKWMMMSALALGLVAGTAEAQENVGSESTPICCGGDCCLIDGTCFTSGQPNPANSCEMCDPSGSNTSWTNSCPSDAGPGDDGDDDDGGCSASGRGAYGFGLPGLALFFLRRRR